MWAAQQHEIHRRVGVGRQVAPRVAQLGHADAVGGLGGASTKRLSHRGGLGGDPHQMKECDRAGRGGGGTERLELIVGGTDGEALHHRNAVVGQTSQQKAQHGIKLVACLQICRHLIERDEDMPEPTLVGVQAHVGHPPGDSGTDVEEVRVAFGACTNHGVGKHDRVGFPPGDLLSEHRTRLRLVRGARPRLAASHRAIRHHLAMRLARPLGRDRPLLPVMFVHATHIERGGDDDTRTQSCQSLRKLEPRIPDVDGAVDVRVTDIDQPRRADNGRHPRHDGHGQRRRRPQLASQHGPIPYAQTLTPAHLLISPSPHLPVFSSPRLPISKRDSILT